MWSLLKVFCTTEWSSSASRPSHSHTTLLLVSALSIFLRRNFITSALWRNNISINYVFRLFASANFIIFNLFASIIVMLLCVTLDFSNISIFFVIIFIISMLYLDPMTHHLCRAISLNVVSFSNFTPVLMRQSKIFRL